jgi:hypothetical protein
MPAIQTTYAQTILPAYEGMIADSREQTVLSMIVETAAGIGFGKVCVQGTADRQVRISEAVKAFRGISLASHFATEKAGLQGTLDAYSQYDNIPVLTAGAIWVLASVAVAAGQPVYYVPATGVITNVLTSNTLSPNSMFETSTTGSGLAVISFKSGG